jgi:hypothetical protein
MKYICTVCKKEYDSPRRSAYCKLCREIHKKEYKKDYGVKYRAKFKVFPQKEKEVVGEKILGRTYRELVEEQYGDVTQWAVLNNKR